MNICSDGSDEPIVTIDFLVSKVYLVNKSSAVAQVQRNAKVITFDPFLDSAAERMVNVSPKGLKLLTSKENGGGDLNRKVCLHLSSRSLPNDRADEHDVVDCKSNASSSPRTRPGHSKPQHGQQPRQIRRRTRLHAQQNL